MEATKVLHRHEISIDLRELVTVARHHPGPLGREAATAWSYSGAGPSPAQLDSAQLNC